MMKGDRGTGNWERGTENGERETGKGNGERGTGHGERGNDGLRFPHKKFNFPNCNPLI